MNVINNIEQVLNPLSDQLRPYLEQLPPEITSSAPYHYVTAHFPLILAASLSLLLLSSFFLLIRRLFSRPSSSPAASPHFSVSSPSSPRPGPSPSSAGPRVPLAVRRMKELPDRTLSLSSQLCHTGTLSEGDFGSGDITAPLHLSTTFRRGDLGEWPQGFAYSRAGNPTRQLLERTAAQLEHGCSGHAFPSGMAAISAVLLSMLRPGDHVVLSDDVYKSVRKVLQVLGAKMGVTSQALDLSDAEALQQALTMHPNTRLVWTEAISNPQGKVADLSAIKHAISTARKLHLDARQSSGVANQSSIKPSSSSSNTNSNSDSDPASINIASSLSLVVDATWVTPVIFQPLLAGADIVIHSCTKYFGGHSDVLGGIVVVKDPAVSAEVRQMQSTFGAVMSPFDCYLCMRGMRTLHLRMERHCASAMAVANYLLQEPEVTAVNYPGLSSSIGHRAAKAQYSSSSTGDVLYGGMISFTIKGGLPEAMGLIQHTQLFVKATSLGATESYIEPSAGSASNSRLPPSMIRLSIGLEDPRELIDDLKRAFQLLKSST